MVTIKVTKSKKFKFLSSDKSELGKLGGKLVSNLGEGR